MDWLVVGLTRRQTATGSTQYWDLLTCREGLIPCHVNTLHFYLIAHYYFMICPVRYNQRVADSWTEYAARSVSERRVHGETRWGQKNLRACYHFSCSMDPAAEPAAEAVSSSLAACMPTTGRVITFWIEICSYFPVCSKVNTTQYPRQTLLEQMLDWLIQLLAVRRAALGVIGWMVLVLNGKLQTFYLHTRHLQNPCQSPAYKLTSPHSLPC